MKLILVDLSGVFFATWHATAGAPVDEAHDRTVSRVRRLVDGYDHAAICCEGGKTFRHEIDPAYKGNRPERDPACLGQLERVIATLRADGLRVYSAPGFEADDCIATFVRWAREQPEAPDVTIASSDKDLLALVGPNVVAQSLSTGEVLGVEGVVAKFGVEPSQVRDFLAIVGDGADNVQGVKGVGPVNASKLLARFGTIEGLVTALDAVDANGVPMVQPDGLRKKLIDGIGAMDLARRLVTLRTDAPIDCSSVLTRPEPAIPDAEYDFDEPAQTEGHPLPPPPPSSGERRPAAKVAPTMPASAPEKPSTSTALAVVTPTSWELALEPTNSGSAWSMAKMLYASRLFGAYQNPEAILAVILKGRTMGLDALTALGEIHIIEGKPCVGAKLMVAMVLRSGYARYFQLIRSTNDAATYKTHRNGDPDPVEMSFTLEDANRARLTGPTRSGKPSQWDKMPRTMLRWRCAAELARAVYPDVIANCYTREEMGEEMEEAS